MTPRFGPPLTISHGFYLWWCPLPVPWCSIPQALSMHRLILQVLIWLSCHHPSEYLVIYILCIMIFLTFQLPDVLKFRFWLWPLVWDGMRVILYVSYLSFCARSSHVLLYFSSSLSHARLTHGILYVSSWLFLPVSSSFLNCHPSFVLYDLVYMAYWFALPFRLDRFHAHHP